MMTVGTIPASIGKFYNFKHLDVSRNGLTGSLPEFLKGIKNCSSEGVFPELRELHLSQNKLTGRLPDWLSKLEKLTILDLEDNKFQGTIPASFGTLRNLERMSLAQNELNGSLPISFGQLSELVELDVSWNRLTGILSEQHFSKLSKLDDLRMEGNSGLVLNVSSTWIPPFQVHHLRMASCNLGPSFPSWLKFQKNLFDLDMSNASISGSIPNWFWNISSGLKYLNLSSNQLQGPIWLPKHLNMTSLVSIDFSSDLFKGPVPLPNSNCRLLDLSNNTLSGSIPPNIGESNLDLEFLYLSNNQITGNIPKSIGYMSNLQMIDLSRNSLTGSIPSSISNCSCLNALNLGQNNLSGAIPNSFAQLNWLQVLHLNKNMLSGELPLSFQNLSSLEILDLSYNKLSGDIPSWSGTALSSLIILKLRTNSFSGAGGLLFGLSNLTSLQILDLAENNLSGSIPSTLGDLMAMSGKHNIRQKFTRLAKKVGNEEDYFDLDKLIVKAKGQDLEYDKFLYLVVSIDLSSNNFIGEFPKEITKLHGLIFLNLSRNHINGSIPQDISMLHELQSLDLSCNNIYGIIPSSMSSLTFLSYLDLSNNNFSGKIPFTGQMTTFNAFAFGGNPQLCGRPLVAHCQGDDLDQGKGQGQSNVEDENDDGFIDQWFYLSIGLGFAVGILGPFFVLVIKKPWCVAYFNLVDKIVDKSLYVVEKMKKHSR